MTESFFGPLQPAERANPESSSGRQQNFRAQLIHVDSEDPAQKEKYELRSTRPSDGCYDSLFGVFFTNITIIYIVGELPLEGDEREDGKSASNVFRRTDEIIKLLYAGCRPCDFNFFFFLISGLRLTE